MTRIRGDIIKAGRHALRQSQVEFARKCGVTRPALAAAEVGLRPLSVTASLRVADHIGLRVEDIYADWRADDDGRAELPGSSDADAASTDLPGPSAA